MSLSTLSGDLAHVDFPKSTYSFWGVLNMVNTPTWQGFRFVSGNLAHVSSFVSSFKPCHPQHFGRQGLLIKIWQGRQFKDLGHLGSGWGFRILLPFQIIPNFHFMHLSLYPVNPPKSMMPAHHPQTWKASCLLMLNLTKHAFAVIVILYLFAPFLTKSSCAQRWYFQSCERRFDHPGVHAPIPLGEMRAPHGNVQKIRKKNMKRFRSWRLL